jgi:GntR family transcriptional regulator/MocR family aminotransferase
MGSQTGPVDGPELLLTLDRAAGTPLHEQLEGSLRDLIRSGRLLPEQRLPSSRDLAKMLTISRGVVLEAYAQLEAEGFITASQGAPTRVAKTPQLELPPLPAGELRARRPYELDPGVPDLSSFPRDVWAKELRNVIREAPFDALGEGDPRGTLELRNALSTYLGRARGAAPEPEHTLILSGFTVAFALLCRTLRARGVERIAVEDPGWLRHRLIAEAAGLHPLPVPVDDSGIVVEELVKAQADAVVVTPSHQFPTGVVLSPRRRAELLDWAEAIDGLIVEDDYDGELRYDRDPVGALQGLAPERIAYIGSASKRLAPALKLGWVLTPSWLTGALTYDLVISQGGAPAIEQLALASFIARGELDRQLRRMRSRYAARREALINELPAMKPLGAAAGIYTAALLPDGADEDAVIAAASAQGVAVDGLSQHRIAEGPPGLVLGFGNLAPEALARAGRLLAAVM